MVIFNLTLQQVLLVIELNKVRNLSQQMSRLPIPCTFENISQKFVMKKGHSTILICPEYIINFSGKSYKLKA